MRTTLAMAKASRIPEALNVSSTDSRFPQYLNEAQLRLLQRGKWWGTYGRYAIAVDSQILTLPAHIETIEMINVESAPLVLRSQWFEFLSNGWGKRDDTLANGSGVSEVLYRGNAPTFKAQTASAQLALKCDLLSDVGKSVRVLGYDTNSNWVRTEVAGIWYDGEAVLLAQGAGTLTATTFSRVSDVQPPSNLNGKWWIYQGPVASNVMIGQYEYWESAPSYKQFLIPFSNATTTTVEIMGKLAYRPVVADTDYFIIGNLAALKLGAMAIKAEEEHNWTEANLLWNGGTLRNGTKIIGAIQELDNELAHELGDGYEPGITLVGSSGGFGEILEPIV